MAARYSVEAIFKAVDRITAPINRMQQRVSRFTRSMRRGFSRVGAVFGTLGRILKRGVQVATVAVFGLGYAMADVVNTGADFNRAVGSAAAKFPGQIQRGTEAFEALRMSAAEVGETTEFTATQGAGALEFFAKAGYDAEFAMTALKPTVDFATATMVDFDRAADVASDTLGAFGLNVSDAAGKAENYQRVMDVIALTTASTNTTIETLFESVKQGGPALKIAGGSLETFAAMAGVLGDAGIKGSIAGVAIKNIALGLAGQGNQAAATLKRLGVATHDASGNLRDQFDVLDDLASKLQHIDQGQHIGIFKAIFGVRSLAAAGVLFDAQTRLRGLRGELELATGTSGRMAAFIRNDVRGSLDALKSVIQGVKLQIFEMNEGGIKRTIDSMTDWIRANRDIIATRIGDFMEDLIERAPELADAFLKVAREAGILLDAVVGIADAIIRIANAPANIMELFSPDRIRQWNNLTGESGAQLTDYAQGRKRDMTIQNAGEYVARSLLESRETNSAELTIRDETGRASLSGDVGPRLQLVRSGAF